MLPPLTLSLYFCPTPLSLFCKDGHISRQCRAGHWAQVKSCYAFAEDWSQFRKCWIRTFKGSLSSLTNRKFRWEAHTQNCDYRQCSRRQTASKRCQRQSLVLFHLANKRCPKRNEVVEEWADVLKSVFKIVACCPWLLNVSCLIFGVECVLGAKLWTYISAGSTARSGLARVGLVSCTVLSSGVHTRAPSNSLKMRSGQRAKMRRHVRGQVNDREQWWRQVVADGEVRLPLRAGDTEWVWPLLCLWSVLTSTTALSLARKGVRYHGGRSKGWDPSLAGLPVAWRSWNGSSPARGVFWHSNARARNTATRGTVAFATSRHF